MIFQESPLISYSFRKLKEIPNKAVGFSLRKCRAYLTVDLDSDHRIVTGNLKISLRVPCAHQKTVRRDIQGLNSSTYI